METDPGAAQILLLIALTVMNAFFAGKEMAVVEDESNHYSILETEDRIINKVIIRIKDKNE